MGKKERPFGKKVAERKAARKRVRRLKTAGFQGPFILCDLNGDVKSR